MYEYVSSLLHSDIITLNYYYYHYYLLILTFDGSATCA